MTHDTSTSKSQPDNSADSKNKASTKASANLHQQCSDLLAEVDAFQSLLKENLRNPQLVEARTFRSNVNSELKMLQKLEQRVIAQSQKSKAAAKEDNDSDEEEEDEEKQQADIDAEIEMRMVHALSSSNMPFYQAVWDITKTSCEGLLSMGKRFYWGVDTREATVGKGGGDKQANKDKRKSVFVDIVAADGEEWVKVSTISESRLIFEMAKKGWEAASEDEYSDSEGERPTRTVLRNFDGEDPGSDDDDDEMELIKLARDLRKASDAVRVRYRHPRVRLVLPKIGEGNVPEVDDILAEVRSYGITVECQGQISRRNDTSLIPLLPQPFKKFTDTLNVDCTLLLAIVSDLSHIDNIPVLPTFHKAIVRQIEVEREMPLLPSELWPAMGSRNLVATQEAATRMREIVELLGTSTEKARMEIFLEDPSAPEVDRHTLIQRFQALSDHRVPEDWALPLKIVDAQPDIKHAVAEKKIPLIAEEVAKELSDINHSVFMYGWATNTTTITSNRTIDRQIESTIEKSREGDDELEGPNVWVCDTARSLVGKDRDRKD